MIFNLRTIKMARWTNIHWESKTRFYRIYNGIKPRCENPKSPAYKYYWVFWLKCEWNTYEDFKKDMYKSYLKHCEKYWEEETTIDRIDNSLWYSKENCRRATHKEQVHNRITTKMYEWKWKKLSVSEIYNKEKPNVLYDTFRQRLKKWWSVERSLKPMW
jgi:hypothetical protein